MFSSTRRVVLKFGTGVLTQGVGGPDPEKIAAFAARLAEWRKRGIEVVVVTSGAIGLGMGRLGLTKRPTGDLPTLQACAAIGQAILMDLWAKGFEPHGLTTAQLLLTRDDLGSRERHLRARATLEKLLELGVIPVINENDSVQTAEITFGDNDTLSAMVSSLVGAELLVILSTIPGFLDMGGTNEVIPVIEKITSDIEARAGGTTSATAVGGMRSKVCAARIALASGCGVFICSGKEASILDELRAGRPIGTYFVPSEKKLPARQRWLAWFDRPEGSIRLDAGAVEAIAKQGRSLLAKGVTEVRGEFATGATVNLEDPEGRIIARGVSGYAAADLRKIAGATSAEITRLLPSHKGGEAVHRDGLVVLG